MPQYRTETAVLVSVACLIGRQSLWLKGESNGRRRGALPLLAAALFAIQEFSGSIATQEAAINRTIIEYELGGQTSQFVIDLDAYDPTAVISYTGSPTIADAVDVQQFYNIPGSANEFEEVVCTYIEDHGGTVTSVETISES